MSLSTKILAADALSSSLISSMFTIFEKYYDFVDEHTFRSDLRKKTHVILLYHKNKLVGFSSAFIGSVGNIKGTVIFSGDTVLEKAHWGSKILQQAFYKLMCLSLLKSPFKPVYWMLMSKGYKTYLLMRKNFPRSFPSFEKKTPILFNKVKNIFYKEYFGQDFKEEYSLIQFSKSKGQLKPGIADPGSCDMKDPNIKFFMESNPGFNNGDELACIAQIRWYDLFYTGLKHSRKWLSRKNKPAVPKLSTQNPLASNIFGLEKEPLEVRRS